MHSICTVFLCSGIQAKLFLVISSEVDRTALAILDFPSK